MRTVWKFGIPVDDHITVTMPNGAELLHVDWQDGQGAQLWAMVDDTEPSERRHFRLVGTGHKLPDYDVSWRFVGTFLVRPPGPPLVFHLWELPPREPTEAIIFETPSENR